MFEHNSNASTFSTSNVSCLDAVAIYGHNSTACNLANLFSCVGIHVYLLSSNKSQIDLSSNNFTIITNRNDLPYLSSVLINCQDDLVSITNLIESFPKDYKQRMAYIECSLSMGFNKIELIYEENKFQYYLCMNLIELESSTTIQRRFHLICSGNKIVFQNLLLKTSIPAKITFLSEAKTPFDSFYICLMHRYSQAMHFMIYIEMMAVLKAANPIYPGNLQFLFDWSYIKRPLMRQIILQSLSSSISFTSINDFQLLLECVIDYFYKKNSNEIDFNHLKHITYKIYQFISKLEMKQKQKPVFELFTLY